MLFLILVLIVALLAVVFAVANTEVTVPVSLLVAEFQDIPVVLLVVISLLIGILVALIGVLPAYVRNKRTITVQRKKITGLEKSVAAEKTQVEQLQLQLNPPPVIPPAPETSVESTGSSIDPAI